MTHRRPLAVLGLVLVALAGCGAPAPRLAAPEAVVSRAAPYGVEIVGLRFWGDELDPADRAAIQQRWPDFAAAKWGPRQARGEPLTETSLVLSGGGPDGAFGAGILAGWTARGDRPRFDIVTGVSTGAILAFFAFLGPDYDDEMEEVYTTFRTQDLLRPAILSALSGGAALTDASGYRGLIERYVGEGEVALLAEAYARGRILLVGTTNLDAARPVVWNLTAIAASGHPDARRLIHDVIQASSAIPGAFPPVLIPVEAADGQIYDELHVDGGATQQVMLFSPDFSLPRLERAAGLEVERTIYVVMNNKLRKPYRPVQPRIGAIARAASSSLIGGSGASDIYKIFAIADRDGMALNVTAVPRDFDEEPQEPFDPVYMSQLYNLGFTMGSEGVDWSPTPPGYLP